DSHRFLHSFPTRRSSDLIFFHCDSVSNGPDRAIGPPSALLTLLIAHSGKLNHHSFKHLSWVMQQLLSVFISFGIPLASLTLFQRSEEHTSELQSRGHLVC